MVGSGREVEFHDVRIDTEPAAALGRLGPGEVTCHADTLFRAIGTLHEFGVRRREQPPLAGHVAAAVAARARAGASTLM